MNSKKIILAGIILALGLMGCGKIKDYQLKKEIRLVVKAVKYQLSALELDKLAKGNHPILIQIGDPGTKELILLFANLPSDFQDELLIKGYLKWKFPDLDPKRQQIWRNIVQINIDMAMKQGAAPNPNFSQDALQEADVGFAVVDIASGGVNAKVISWYILWPASQPTWITVVNARFAGNQPYFDAHLKQLPLIAGKPDSELPSE